MDDGSVPLCGTFFMILFILISFLLHLYSSAVLHCNENSFEKQIEEQDKAYLWMIRMKDDPLLMLGTVHLITILMACLVAIFTLPNLAGYFNGVFIGFTGRGISVCLSWILSFAIGLLCMVSLAYLLPVRIGRYYAEQIIKVFHRPLCRLFGLAGLLTVLFDLPVCGIIRLFRMDPHHFSEDVTEDEIIDLVDEAHEQGVILESEAEMIQNIMEFGDKTARDIMTHRKNLNALESSTSFSQAMKFVLEKTNTRYPVYDETIDNIIGLIHLKDMAVMGEKEELRDLPLNQIPGLIRGVGFVPETRRIDSIFKAMQANKVHMAVVIDEYGQTAGIVTMEDILEEIVGNILDEHDDIEHFVQHLYDNSMMMDGLTPIEQVEEALDTEIDDEEYDTLNGYLTSLLDHIPTKDDKFVEDKGFRFQIISVEDNMIRKVRVTKL